MLCIIILAEKSLEYKTTLNINWNHIVGISSQLVRILCGNDRIGLPSVLD